MPSSSSASTAKPEFSRGSQVAGWTVVRQIGSGSFGIVYEVEKDGQRAAMKTEYVHSGRSESLRMEAKQLRILQFSAHFCRLYLACQLDKSVFGEENDVNLMVMELAATSLSRLRKQMPERRFSVGTAVRLSKQCLQAVQDMHLVGLLHRDIKPGNFVWSEASRRVILLDLGMCRRFMHVSPVSGKAEHRPARRRAHFNGTEQYCSVNVHNREEASRRDDLWSWLYATMEMLRGKLDWEDETEHETCRMKERLDASSKYFPKPHSREFREIHDHIKRLKYASRPDYALLHRQLDSILTAKGLTDSDPHDWESGGTHYDWLAQKESLKRKVDDEEPVGSSVTGSEETSSGS